MLAADPVSAPSDAFAGATNVSDASVARTPTQAFFMRHESAARAKAAIVHPSRPTSGEQRLELLRLGYWPFAGKTLADVGRGVAVDGRAALEQRHAVPPAAREHEGRAE